MAIFSQKLTRFGGGSQKSTNVHANQSWRRIWRGQGFDTGFSDGIVAAPEVQPDGCSVFLLLN